ncbi:putative RNA-directed DNA polymerase, eukaryota, reverse transcriptase zinc-binding domain protein [Tanacetum coccineum]
MSGQPHAYSLDQLKEGDEGTIVVMVCRKWDVHNVNVRYLSIDFVISDEKFDAAHMMVLLYVAVLFSFEFRMFEEILITKRVNVDLLDGETQANMLHVRIASMKLLSDIDRKDASDIAQKVKVKWALEGDENTSFFHSMLKKNQRQFAIKGILHNGFWIENPGEVKSEFLNHFRNRLSCSNSYHPSVGDVHFNQITEDQCKFLECDVTNEEIRKAVWDCGVDRAPGPDGFTFKIFKTYWEVNQSDVVKFVREFFQSARFPKGCNSSFIALIPKVGDAKFVSDFRPISLIGCQYKIIGKILANRLSMVVGTCVSPVQSTFIKGRNILDGPLILNECMAWYRKKKKDLMVFKVDFEKAFDSLRWDYLNTIMEKLGFGNKWRSWIAGCLNHSRASILVNGSPTSEFELSKGLHQ